MPNYSQLLAAINTAIYENNNQEIDALDLRGILREMVTSLGSGYLFKGIATPSSPGTAQTPDQNVFYLATTAGTYTYLGGLVVSAGEVALLCYDGTWTKKTSGLLSAESVASILNGLFPRVEENGWHLVDEQLNIALKYDADGLDAAKVSEHFVELLKAAGIAGDSPALSSFVFTNEPGFAIVDPLLNIGVKVNNSGIYARNLLEYEIVNN